MLKHNWDKYLHLTKQRPPRPLLVRAVDFVQDKKRALDVGAGSLNDTRYLLSIGFQHVTAVDSNPAMKKFGNKISKRKATLRVATFEQFRFQKNTFNLVNAQYS